MPPKNKPKNSFYFFMKEVQENEAAKGRTVTMKTLPNLAHPIWAKMSLVERQPYEEKARRYKNDPSLRGGKLASDGTRVEDNLREIEDLERREKDMIDDLQTYLNSNLPDHFKEFASRRLMYFLSFNILCCTETEFIPIEVGLVEYSIQHGIHREFHKILYPGHIPTGYAGEAKRLSEDKHGLEIFSPEEDSERDMFAVYNSIKRFIKPPDRDELPPVFSMEEDIEQTKGCLKWLASKAKAQDNFVVFNSKYLLLELRSGVGHPLHSYTSAAELLNSSSFNYNPAARCKLHVDQDNHHCALGFSKRLCYMISDAVCKQFEVDLTECHIPSQFVEEKAYSVSKPNNVSRTRRGPVAPTSVRLDQRSNYYQNEVAERDQFADKPTVSPPPVPAPAVERNVPRQPSTECIAAQMARLKLKSTAAAVPGLGIGRGQRRNN